MLTWDQLICGALGRLRDERRFRQRKVLRILDATHVEFEGRRFVNFASNNYLGLTHHPKVIAAAREAEERDGAGAGAAALITGYGPRHASAEIALARWKRTGAAILLPSGYQANHAAIQTVAALAEGDGGVRFLFDKLVHASVIDAVRGTGQPYRVYPHN